MTSPLQGHRWTLEPYVRSLVAPLPAAPSRRIRVPFHDPARGEIGITGRLGPEPPGDELLVAIHGLGGHAGSYYMHRAAHAARQAGIGCLRMNMRGADRSGDDIYHGGLAEDVGRLLAAPELAQVRRIYLVGYSLGGHLALAYAASGRVDERVRSVASICAPLDFDAGASELDKARFSVYRNHLLRGLKQSYQVAHARRELTVSAERAMRVRRLREWDTLIVAPRFGFESAEHYYASVSVGPKLGAIELPTLMLVADHDPMVKLDTLAGSLAKAGRVQVLRTPHGGHVGFPTEVDLGLGTRANVESQVVSWLRENGGRAAGATS